MAEEPKNPNEEDLNFDEEMISEEGEAASMDEELISEDEISKILNQGSSREPEASEDDDILSEEDLQGILSGSSRSSGGGDDDDDLIHEEAFSQADVDSILNQTDIDAIMAEAGTSPQTLIFRHDGRRVNRGEKITIEEFDFSNPVFMTEGEMRQVRIRHEQFVHHLSARLSMFLRMDVGLKMAKLFTTQYQNHTNSISSPTHISLFKLEQFNGVGIVDINPRLAMTMVDRLLGGPGHSVRGERYLTDLEVVLIEDVVEVILKEWCAQWEDIYELNSSIIGNENNGRFLQTSPRDTILLVVVIEAVMGDCTETLEIALPYYTMQPVLKKLQDETKKFSTLNTTEKTQHWWKTYDHIKVPISAEWSGFECSVRDLLMLRPGDVVMMPEGILDKTLLRMNNTVPYRGKVGVQDGQVAVQVTEQLLDL
ncbi:MAG: FliM/FliN family flagellar motor switch protein [Verrucomicrobiota bacterium JB022]|nr:FliM/FliN family flagellar motor switch protein [Verrucomicrobiota bacterium JB022]